MPQIAAFGEAVRIAKAEMPEANKRMEALRAQCVQTLTDTVPGIVFLGGGSAHILSLSLPGYRSEVLMNYLEAKGIYVSKSSACKRGKRSHVLEAIGRAGQGHRRGAARFVLALHDRGGMRLFLRSARRGAKGTLPFPLTNLLYSSAAAASRAAAARLLQRQPDYIK